MRSHVLKRRFPGADGFLGESSLSTRTVLESGLALELESDPWRCLELADGQVICVVGSGSLSACGGIIRCVE